MTTLQPRLVRADTLDLQSHDAPSAKDHTRSPTFSPYAHGSSGIHHREALRHAEESAYSDRKSSPRVSMEENSSNPRHNAHQYDSTDDDADDEQVDGPNGSVQNEGDYEESNEENEDDLEDDLLDKISSSPSIEDGKYSHFLWPPRIDSVEPGASPASSSTPSRGSSPSILHPVSLHIEPVKTLDSVGHHLSGQSEGNKVEQSRYMFNTGYNSGHDPYLSMATSSPVPDPKPSTSVNTVSIEDVAQYLFPINDPILEDGESDEVEDGWVDEGEPWYEIESSSDDDSEPFHFSSETRFIDSGWGGECLREVEDIDFEFVYALHTFVATVEGQANATKGDTMVLLDDSNSYWWLVRVVKDGSIGYLPAEHIETPTERLARLNKHRNIDLSASMLGDNPEKSKNPLKKAMRRRNAKTVAFTAPTYYEPSEYEYDSEDDEEEEGIQHIAHTQQQATQHETNAAHEDALSTETHDSIIIVNGIKNVASDDQLSAEAPNNSAKSEAMDPASTQLQVEESTSRSRNGVVRNTDSFFKDDSVETKKISLTPRLLRNDTDSSSPAVTTTATSTDQDLRSKSSSDTFDKVLGSDEKTKEKEKEKKKEKKGMLSGLFKRKDKSAKNAKADVEDEKVDDVSRVPQTKESLEAISGPQSPDKKPGKLQKHQPTISTTSKHPSTDMKQPLTQTSNTSSPAHSPKVSENIIPLSNTSKTQQEMSAATQQGLQSEQLANQQASHTEKRSIFTPITTVLKSSPTTANEHDASNKPVYSKRAKERFAIDVSDSEDDHTPTISNTVQDQRAVSPIRTSQIHDSRPDSAMEVSPVDSSDAEFTEPMLQSQSETTRHLSREHDKSIHDGHEGPMSDTASTSKPSPSFATHTPSTSRSTPTWSDASLRSYMESDQDIRDLLIIVHDKSNITPVGPDHPLMGGLFMTERTRLAEMQTQLDSMLTTWISKKNPGLLAR